MTARLPGEIFNDDFRNRCPQSSADHAGYRGASDTIYDSGGFFTLGARLCFDGNALFTNAL